MNLLDQIRANIRTALDARAAQQGDLDTLVSTAEARSGDDAGFTPEEEARFGELRTALGEADAAIAALEGREAELVAAAEARTRAEELSTRIGGPAAPEVRVGREAAVYRADGEHQFIADAFRAEFVGDYAARDRIQRHQAQMADELRATTTGTFGGLVVPQYLTDLYAPLARAGRPFANTVRNVPLPDEGMSMVVPRITTGTSAAAQATQNTAVSNTDIAVTDLTIPVVTIAGQQDVSRQSLDRGRGVDQIVFADLGGAYDVNLDQQALNGPGTGGTMLGALQTAGIQAVTYTDATPTLAELFPKLADAIQRINGARFMPATVIVMHPRRWGWMTAQVDTTGRPLVTNAAPMNPVGLGEAAKYGQIVGSILGVPVVTDANIPTNLGGGTEDIILVAKADDLLLMEDAGPKQLRFEQTLGNQLTVKLVLFNYAAFTAGRYPASVATVGGTGLIAPTF